MTLDEIENKLAENTQQDPYTAYQNLSMWVNNQAQPIKPIPPMKDEDMVSIKGFDKYSFRKDKTT